MYHLISLMKPTLYSITFSKYHHPHSCGVVGSVVCNCTLNIKLLFGMWEGVVCENLFSLSCYIGCYEKLQKPRKENLKVISTEFPLRLKYTIVFSNTINGKLSSRSPVWVGLEPASPWAANRMIYQLTSFNQSGLLVEFFYQGYSGIMQLLLIPDLSFMSMTAVGSGRFFCSFVHHCTTFMVLRPEHFPSVFSCA